jgi:hypothetical protein
MKEERPAWGRKIRGTKGKTDEPPIDWRIREQRRILAAERSWREASLSAWMRKIKTG